jgi:NADPH2:quinone reductase
MVKEAGGPEVLELTEITLRAPGPGEVLIRVDSIGVGRPDVLFRSGVYKWMPPLPAVLGAEATGTIEALGPGVSELAPGDRVLASYAALGCYAEYVVAPANNVLKLVAGLDLETAIHIPNYVTAQALLTDAIANRDISSLYVNGAAGGVGVAIIQTAKLRGVTVYAGVGSAEKARFAQGLGATQAIDYSRTEAAKEVLASTRGGGVDLVLDHLAGPRFVENFAMVAPLGIIVSFNILGGFPAMDLFREMRANLAKSPAVRCFSGHVYDTMPERLEVHQQNAMALLREGRVSPVVFDRLPLDGARRAHELLDSRKVLGKLLLKP